MADEFSFVQVGDEGVAGLGEGGVGEGAAVVTGDGISPFQDVGGIEVSKCFPQEVEAVALVGHHSAALVEKRKAVGEEMLLLAGEVMQYIPADVLGQMAELLLFPDEEGACCTDQTVLHAGVQFPV